MELVPENFEALYVGVDDADLRLKENTVKSFFDLHHYKWIKKMTNLKKVILLLYDYCERGRLLDQDTRKGIEKEIVAHMDEDLTKTEVGKAIAF